MLVTSSGISKFLSDTFINNVAGSLSPEFLIKKLTDFPDVGKVVYSRPRRNKAPHAKFVTVTILQLIACELIQHLPLTELKTNVHAKSLLLILSLHI